MLVEIAIGDAYGAGFEFCERAKITQYNDLTAYQQHYLGMPAGSYTDDTQMSIAIAELMLHHLDWSPTHIADGFVRAFKRDERLGYAKGLHQLLTEVEDGAALLATLRPDSSRNGAAMRSVPLGLVKDQQAMEQQCRMQAQLTHNTPGGVVSALAVAYAGHYLAYQLGPVDQLTTFVSEKTEHAWRNDWDAEVECDGIQTVHAVMTVMSLHRSYANILRHSVALGGDVDSVAAIALGLASLSTAYQRDLPEHLYTGLEQGNYGMAYLRELDARLSAQFGLPLLAGNS